MTDTPNIVSLRNGKTFTPSNPTNTPRQEVISLLEETLTKLRLGDDSHYVHASACIIVMLSDQDEENQPSIGVLCTGLNAAEVIGELHAASYMMMSRGN